VPPVEQELLILPEHMSSPWVFSGVRVTRSLVLCVMFIRSLFVHLSFFFWSLCCLSLDLRLLITFYVSCGHCVVCPSSIYGLWWPLWYLVAIVLSVLRFTASDDLFGILWPLCCLSFFDLRLLIIFLVYCGHCVVCPSSIYGFWWPFWYLQTLSSKQYHLSILIIDILLLFHETWIYSCSRNTSKLSAIILLSYI
jgi:hypothetical protein